MLSRLALRKTSLVDFPGRVSAVLFAPGCNFRCPYCQNAALVVGYGGGEEEDAFISRDEALAFIHSRVGRISGVVLSGGEPLLNEDVASFIRSVKAEGLAVKVDTNGSFPERLRAVEADFIALDLKTAPSRYALVAPDVPGAGERLVETLAFLRDSGADYEIRITCAPGVVDAGDLEEIAALLRPEDDVVLQAFRPGGCLDPAWDAVEPYPPSLLEDFRARLAKAAPKTRIRGLFKNGG